MTDNIVTKAQIIDIVAAQVSTTKVTATKVVEAFVNTVIDEVAKGNKISINKFGVFETRHRSARKGRNPQTGEEITIEASTTPGFKASKNFKDKVSQLVEQLL